MPTRQEHSWDLTPAEARALQLDLQSKVVTRDRFNKPQTVAGVDVGFEAQGTITRAAVVVLSFPELIPLDQAVSRQPTRFPYVPGLLSFREIPAILEAMQMLRQPPDMLLCDGQGLAHPRRFGLACHLGLLTDIPSIGVAKSRLIGTHGDLSEIKGSWVPLMDKEEIIGAVLRTRSRVNPVYISVGHRISLESAIQYVLACTTRFKLPETTRAAHNLASN
ncbi:MAG: deoxyribonuclease V [Pseudomonadota bacterium]